MSSKGLIPSIVFSNHAVGIDAVNFSQHINLSPTPHRRQLNTLIDDGHDLGVLAALLHVKEQFSPMAQDASLGAGVALETAMESFHYGICSSKLEILIRFQGPVWVR